MKLQINPGWTNGQKVVLQMFIIKKRGNERALIDDTKSQISIWYINIFHLKNMTDRPLDQENYMADAQCPQISAGQTDNDIYL